MELNNNEILLKPNNILYEIISGITYFKLISEYEGDYTKNCGLFGEEIDKNFYFLRGYDIDTINIDETGNLIITRINKNQEPIKVNIGDKLNIALEDYTTKQDVAEQIISASNKVVESATSYTNTKIKELSDIYAPKESIETLVGEDTDKTVRTIAAEEVVKIVNGAPESYDTLKEIADWILNDTTGAAAMANDINELKAISADTRLDALESDTHKHENKEALNKITNEKIETWDGALTDARNFTTGEIAKLSEVYDAKGAAADALGDAKKYVDGKLVDYATQSFVTDKITSALTGDIDITGYAKTEEVKVQVASAKTEAIAIAKEYTNTEIDKLSDVYATKNSLEIIYEKSHTHDNKDVLNNISQIEINKWNTYENKIKELEDEIVDLKNKISSLENTEFIKNIIKDYLRGVDKEIKVEEHNNYLNIGFDDNAIFG